MNQYHPQSQQTVFQALLQQEDVSVPDSQEHMKMSFFVKQKILQMAVGRELLRKHIRFLLQWTLSKLTLTVCQPCTSTKQ